MTHAKLLNNSKLKYIAMGDYGHKFHFWGDFNTLIFELGFLIKSMITTPKKKSTREKSINPPLISKFL